NQPYESTLNVNSIFPDVLNSLDDISSVCIDIDADNNDVSDLSVWLISPNGSRLELTSNNGTGRTGYRQTCFTPTATDLITGGTAPFTGEFLPEGPWDNLLGGEVNGDWRLQVSDNNGNRETSTLLSWSIEFTSRNDISYAWTPAVGLSCDDCPNPELINSGNISDAYSITASDQYNCESTAEIIVTNISNINVPSITCEVNDNKELVIGWNDPSSSDYEISLDNGINWFAPDDPNLHALNGLQRDEVVNISLRPILQDVPIICNIPMNDTVCIYVGCELELMLMDSDLEVSCFDSEDGMVEFSWQDGLAPYQYVYNNNASNIDQESHRIDSIAAGEHRFVINDAEGCSDTIVFQITAPEALELNATIENPRCADDRNGTIELEVNGGTPEYAYSLDGIVFDSKAVFAGLGAGDYEVIIKDQNECEFQQSIILENPESIEVIINKEDEEFIQMIYGDEVQLFASVINGQGILDYTWSSINGDSTLSCINCPDPFINPIMTTYFELEVEDENGCRSSDRVQVRVERIFKHYVPNAFSPNENGVNERLTVYSENDAVIKSFQVYDRWGGLVFSASDFAANDLMSGWDGTGRN
ncbi:MAG: proprotein convertase P-domain-containing protein, partial [Bacteroidota bacterium]